LLRAPAPSSSLSSLLVRRDVVREDGRRHVHILTRIDRVSSAASLLLLLLLLLHGFGR
jgi:hypothetical protein